MLILNTRQIVAASSTCSTHLQHVGLNGLRAAGHRPALLDSWDWQNRLPPTCLVNGGQIGDGWWCSVTMVLMGMTWIRMG